jgi:hypothetical protein
LVHGTWASGALWTRKDSALCRRLSEAFGAVTIESIPWSGRNRFRDRLEASALIIEVARKCRTQNRPLFLIGHSHGGSAIAYALRKCAELQSAVAGAVFFSTPFFGIAPRPGYRSLYKALTLIATVAAFIGGAFALGYLVPSGSWSSEAEWRGYLALALVAVLCALCVWLALWLRRGRWIDRVSQRVLAEAEQFDTMTVQGPPLLFVRTTGDEVAMALSALQLLCYLNNAFATYVALAIDAVVRRVGAAWTRWPGKVVLTLFLAAAILAASLAGTASRLFGFWFENTLDVLNPFSTGWGFVESDAELTLPLLLEFLYRVALGFLDLSLIVLAAAGSLLPIALLLVSVSSTLNYWAIGRFDPLGALMLELAAEPTPRGEQSFVHVSWDQRAQERADGNLVLRHSKPYADPQSLDAVCAWVRRTIDTSERPLFGTDN